MPKRPHFFNFIRRGFEVTTPPSSLHFYNYSTKTITMATTTITLAERQTKPTSSSLAPEPERFLRCCSDISSFLVQEFEASQDSTKPKKDLNLNSLRSKFSKKHRLSNIPPLTAIIAAIPEHYVCMIPGARLLTSLYHQTNINPRKSISYRSLLRSQFDLRQASPWLL